MIQRVPNSSERASETSRVPNFMPRKPRKPIKSIFTLKPTCSSFRALGSFPNFAFHQTSPSSQVSRKSEKETSSGPSCTVGSPKEPVEYHKKHQAQTYRASNGSGVIELAQKCQALRNQRLFWFFFSFFIPVSFSVWLSVFEDRRCAWPFQLIESSP